MVSITLSISEEFKSCLKTFSWINWSEIAREEAVKKLIFEDYVRTGILSDDDWEFCDKMDWHPADELPLKDEFKKEMEKRKKEKFTRLKSADQIFKY